GSIYEKSGPCIEFTVASNLLAADVHHALCRLGIVAKLSRQTERAWRVAITEPESVDRYQELVGWLGEKADRFPVEAIDALDASARHGCAGHPPREAWAFVRLAADCQGMTLTDVMRLSGERVKRGFNPHV